MLTPVPAIDPGFRVHVPDAGNPFNTKLPVAEAHEDGCVIVPGTGAEGAAGAALIVIVADACEIQPASLVT